ncbi:MAG: helix-turn-helix transcriptional regulator [Lachnospiraceae bacterium]|nr:helix-turn-helix transcriptional regulator [Lachnospiraceae bacterium]
MGNNTETTITLSPDATMGDKIHAARVSQNMSQAELSRLTGLSARAIRYYESNNRTPSVDAIKKIAEALGLATSYFMDDADFQEQLEREAFLAEAKEKYGSRGKAQAKRIAEEARALYAGGELSEADKQGFMEEMMEIFMISKEEAKVYTPKKYMKKD